MAGETISADLLVSILHHGDSSFPSGGFAFSSGLEEFFADQMIKNVAELESFIADLLINRWISFDAVALRRSAAECGRRLARAKRRPRAARGDCLPGKPFSRGCRRRRAGGRKPLSFRQSLGIG